MKPPRPDSHKLPRVILLATAGLVFLTLLVGFLAMFRSSPPGRDDFIRQSNLGKTYLDQGESAKAAAAFERALALQPHDTNALLNLSRACLRANEAERSLRLAQEALDMAPSSAAACYLAGCSALRLGRFTNAVQYLQQAKDLDRAVNAVSFQLGRAYQQMGQWKAALDAFQEVVRFEPEHPAAYYNLSQVLLRLGQSEEAKQALETHQRIRESKPSPSSDPSVFERCLYTQAKVPFRLEQPDPHGIRVAFVDATRTVFPQDDGPFHGPVGVLDLNGNGRYSLLVGAGSNALRLLAWTNGTFAPAGAAIPSLAGNQNHRCLVGDLNNDRVDDVLVLGENGSQVLKFTTNGFVSDLSQFSRAKSVKASDGVLADVDFTGKLDLVAFGKGTNALRIFRNLGQPYFIDFTTNSGMPLSLSGVRQVVVEDWNGDDLLDLIVAREGLAPALYTKARGGPLIPTNSPPNWPVASVIAVADFNNDSKPDLIGAKENELICVLNGFEKPLVLPAPRLTVRSLTALDYDNDGWLDIVATGTGIQVWRNQGAAGFENVTAKLAPLSEISSPVASLTAADFDLDGDSDWLLTMEDGALRYLRNDGGNANQQLKIHLVGTKSNASGLGIRLELTAGGLHLNRRVRNLPVEIGIGKNAQVDSLTAHWFDFDVGTTDIQVNPRLALTFMELQIRDGSCPYVYAWDGRQFRFVTDVLGASPLGLRISDDHFVESYPFEYVWLGNSRDLGTREDNYVLQITEELREVLYLDQAVLVAADHAAGTEVHPTSKLVPGKPFPKAGLVTIQNRRPLVKAVTLEGADVTDLLADIDSRLVSPTRLRVPQLRGLAEPHGVILDFGPLESQRPWVLALTGWLRYGGGMANVAASHDPDLPYPFPILDAEGPDGRWRKLDLVVGAPAGNTKTILVDLEGKLPAGCGRLRLTTAYEIHWDRIALFEARKTADTRLTRVFPNWSDLHWRGFSELFDLPWNQPLTPDYRRVRSAPAWRITPCGWCTRYGPVGELILNQDNALALINGGDELTVKFSASAIPQPAAGMERDFFLYLVGWDKDSDFHVEQGANVDPLPWHGLDDQAYGREVRPRFSNDDWMVHYNTRWVGPRILIRRNAP
jgi:Flp pilus assembly protein TadD